MRVSSICRILCGAALATTCCVPVAAQSTTTYYSSACVKVKAGGASDFASQVSGNMLKLEESQTKAGKISGWLALRAVVPSGKEARCDYLFVTFFPGLAKPSMSDEEFTAALHRAGMNMTRDAFWAPIMKDAYLVSNEVGEMPVMIGNGKKGDYDVVNDMDMPDANQCVTTETKLWQPFAEARMKAGKQSGWGIWLTTYPRGSKVEGSAGTVDIYPTWDAIFMQGFAKTWQEAQPGVKPADAMAQFNKECKIEMSVVYEEVEDVHAPAQ